MSVRISLEVMDLVNEGVELNRKNGQYDEKICKEIGRILIKQGEFERRKQERELTKLLKYFNRRELSELIFKVRNQVDEKNGKE